MQKIIPRELQYTCSTQFVALLTWLISKPAQIKVKIFVVWGIREYELKERELDIKSREADAKSFDAYNNQNNTNMQNNQNTNIIIFD